MPSSVVGGIISFVEANVFPTITLWEGETPRQDLTGLPIYPPVFNCKMPENGVQQQYTTEDTYAEVGIIYIRLWTTTLQSCESYVNLIYNLLVKESNWYTIDVGASAEVFAILPVRTSFFQLEGARTKNNDLLFEGQIDLEVQVAITTTTR